MHKTAVIDAVALSPNLINAQTTPRLHAFRASGAAGTIDAVIPDVYTQPAALRRQLQDKLGTFPLFNFWGPATDIKATRWIADATIDVDRELNSTLTLVYLPHMDYVLQKTDPRGPAKDHDLRDL